MILIKSLIEAGKYAEALEDINRALSNDDYNISLLTLKSYVLKELNDYTEGINVHNTIINLLPNDAEQYANRGLLYHFLNDHQQSLDDFNQAVALEPTNGYRYASRAFIKDHTGDHEGAIADYTKAIELDSEDEVSLNNRGIIEEKLGRMRLAKESFALADELEPVNNIPSRPAGITDTSVVNTNVNFKHFVSVVKALATSATERRAFFKFLFKK